MPCQELSDPFRESQLINYSEHLRTALEMTCSNSVSRATMEYWKLGQMPIPSVRLANDRLSFTGQPCSWITLLVRANSGFYYYSFHICSKRLGMLIGSACYTSVTIFFQLPCRRISIFGTARARSVVSGIHIYTVSVHLSIILTLSCKDPKAHSINLCNTSSLYQNEDQNCCKHCSNSNLSSRCEKSFSFPRQCHPC